MIMYKTIKQFSAESGYTPDAIRTKIKRGVWKEGVWVKAPDNRILISVDAYNEWAISKEDNPPSFGRSPSPLVGCKSKRRSPLPLVIPD
jgi:hypothetical protein